MSFFSGLILWTSISTLFSTLSLAAEYEIDTSIESVGSLHKSDTFRLQGLSDDGADLGRKEHEIIDLGWGERVVNLTTPDNVWENSFLDDSCALGDYSTGTGSKTRRVAAYVKILSFTKDRRYALTEYTTDENNDRAGPPSSFMYDVELAGDVIWNAITFIPVVFGMGMGIDVTHSGTGCNKSTYVMISISDFERSRNMGDIKNRNFESDQDCLRRWSRYDKLDCREAY